MAKTKNLIGCRFGKLVVQDKTEKRQDRYAVWHCQCDCGGEIEVNTKRLMRGTITNCGCVPKKSARNGQNAGDLTGQVFGELTVLARAETINNRIRWKCRCSCGNETVVSGHSLRTGRTRSCGCLRCSRKRPVENLTGKRFGKLTVLYRIDKREGKSTVCWHCKCDCGQEADVTEYALIYGNCKSCGCLRTETWKNIPNRLHRIDGTCVEILEKRKSRSDNTSGFRGVYQKKDGGYRVLIGFKGKRLYVGSYKNYEEAVDARLNAEREIHERFVRAYYIWKKELEDAGTDEKEQPLVFEVKKVKGKFQIISNVNIN